ncbi:hypothetical protein GE115_07830 [Agromyces sp. CFH 90414]|uniref:DUF3352 domain-containing protein n=1 Tax=Agromyces agglutinans TaxID=2662258 RepID=A0A6I2FBF4_9MICO|nr:hypothetical protein [Agromyces agglutinans]MRG59776.1 hypothetical protein [Agromyces agglutinans]
MTFFRAGAVIAPFLAVALLAGCASTGSGASGSTGLAGELAFVPAGDQILYSDLEGARAALGLESDAPAVEVLTELDEELGVIAPQSFDWWEIDLAEDVEGAIGVSVLDVGRFVESRDAEGADILAFDAPDDAAARLTKALGDPVDGLWEHGEVDGGVDLSAEGGRAAIYSQRIAEIDGRLVIAGRSETIGQIRDGESAANDERAVAAAAALDGRGVLSAMLFEPRNEVLPGATYVGGGVSHGDDGVSVHFVAVAQGDAEALADAMRELFESGTTFRGTPFADLVSVDEVTVSGDVVVVDARPTAAANVWSQMLLQGELG